MRGLRAAVEYNPQAAQYLLDILRGLPIGVRYKPQDRYGPLGMMLSALAPTLQITDKVSIQREAEPFPEERLKDCETFNAEWLQRRFTKQELANAIESILNEVAQRPMLEQVTPNMALIFRADGTFLHNPDEKSEPLKKLS
jgi:hypothetical protein